MKSFAEQLFAARQNYEVAINFIMIGVLGNMVRRESLLETMVFLTYNVAAEKTTGDLGGAPEGSTGEMTEWTVSANEK